MWYLWFICSWCLNNAIIFCKPSILYLLLKYRKYIMYFGQSILNTLSKVFYPSLSGTHYVLPVMWMTSCHVFIQCKDFNVWCKKTQNVKNNEYLVMLMIAMTMLNFLITIITLQTAQTCCLFWIYVKWRHEISRNQTCYCKH